MYRYKIRNKTARTGNEIRISRPFCHQHAQPSDQSYHIKMPPAKQIYIFVSCMENDVNSHMAKLYFFLATNNLLTDWLAG